MGSIVHGIQLMYNYDMYLKVNFLLALSLLISAHQAWAASGIALYNELRASIVTVTGKTPSVIDGRPAFLQTWGAGVILDATGTIATNTHIIYGADYIQITLNTGQILPARVLFISPTEDLSLLKIDPPSPLEPITWADSSLTRLDDEVITIGHSELLKSTISGGHVRAIGIHKNDPTQTPEFLELNINHYQGDSGGPVFTRQGEFLGLINAKRLNENRACFAIPSHKIHFAYLSLAQPTKNR